MKFDYLTGDLLNSGESVVAHGCNCQGVMGAGIARQIRQTHPEAFYVYEAACMSGRFRLGSALPVMSSPAGYPSTWVYNLGTQIQPGPDARVWGVFLAFANMAEDMAARHLDRVAIPRIGCGIGALTWDQVEQAITTAINASSSPDLTVAVYDLPVTP